MVLMNYMTRWKGNTIACPPFKIIYDIEQKKALHVMQNLWVLWFEFQTMKTVD